MSKRLYVFILCFLSFNAFAVGDNPFAKNDVLTVGKDVAWNIDKKAKLATKTAVNKGTYYHLRFDNKQLKLSITSDAAGNRPKSFNQLEVKDVSIDGKQSSLFKWCLANQERHKRFLQQGLQVKKGVCAIDGTAGSFIIKLNKDTLVALQKGSRLTVMLKPFRTPLELKYDISDFNDMYVALNARPAPVVAAPVAAVAVPAAKAPAAVKPKKKCWAGAPPAYKNIKSVGYDCDDASSKMKAENEVARLVNQEKEKQRKLAAEKEKQRKLAEEQKQKELAAKLKEEERLQAEAAAIAASQAKQAQIDSEITQKMVSVCEKYWSKGEHRCYCQKYIDHAPASIQASSTCK
ncbi:MAG: hypothetical protein KJO03_09245 [Gammaproteobacteria bacterium]|nr:hypothetical protein [Gammaproteobacteria bacterium]NNJ50001.1 hypothetical protein [Gammaproteobacteria bacterium]